MPKNIQLEATSPVDPDVYGAVQALLPDAYKHLAKTHRALGRLPLIGLMGYKGSSPENIHQQRLCEQASRWMLRNLALPNHDIHRHEAKSGSRTHDIASNPVFASIPSNRYPHIPIPEQPSHFYPVVGDIETGVAIDLVWQQFLPEHLKGDNGLPQALIGTRSSLRDTAQRYGVTSADALGFWHLPTVDHPTPIKVLTSA